MTLVHVGGVEALAYLRNEENLSDVLRELQLIRLGRDDGSASNPLPEGLVALIPKLLSAYAGPREDARRMAEGARERGEERFDLVLEVPDGAAASLEHLVDLLEEVDEFCRSGDLLTLPADAEVASLRRRVVSEIGAQVRASGACSHPSSA